MDQLTFSDGTVAAVNGSKRLQFRIPYPLSVNHIHITTSRGRRIKTDEARAWEHATYHRIVQQLGTERPDLSRAERLHIEMVYHVGAGQRRLDIDNTLKLSIDTIASVFGFNDRNIKKWILEEADRVDGDGYVDVVLEAIEVTPKRRQRARRSV